MTARDREIVRWIGRLRMASAAQVAKRFRLGRAVNYARLSGLVRHRLLTHVRIFHGEPGVYLATRAGLSIVDLELPPARVDIRTYTHDIELSSLVVELEREFGPDRVRTERETRAADTSLGTAPTKQQRFAVQLTGAHGQLQLTPAGHPRLHFPDCTVVAAPGDPAETVSPLSSSGPPKAALGCAESSLDTSPRDTLARCVTTPSASASATSSRARWPHSGPTP